MTIDEMIAVLQAAKEGKAIQARLRNSPTDQWEVVSPSWNFAQCDFRIKPTPREWWINFYEGNSPCHAFTTRYSAIACSSPGPDYHCIHVREVLDEPPTT